MYKLFIDKTRIFRKYILSTRTIMYVVNGITFPKPKQTLHNSGNESSVSFLWMFVDNMKVTTMKMVPAVLCAEIWPKVTV